MNNWIDLYNLLKGNYEEEPEHLLIEYIDLIDKGKVLDLGVGNGRNSLFLSAIGYDVEGVDISDDNIKNYLEKSKELQLDVKGTVADIRKFEIKENEYSLIIVSWVLNFFRKNEIDYIIEKIKKGLRENGVVYFGAFSIFDDFYIKNLDKTCDEQYSLYFSKSGYRHYYTKEEVLKYFEDLKMIAFKSGMFLDVDKENGDHYHDGFEYVGKKIKNVK
ncbi:methyltransferase domain-containing protein [Romboutsia weinsteinii]|uniref:Methyltransferase domain-containing protein n=1 Tax=Romboutsia weinsteinii TaxID=2020949 RepID=A0A371J4B2_9FIRM|nr:methyltransferase domain-containing protein [Romboutsia weinsteinii]RDY27599.1 methyltransferase domain-containing protein [Romboutsia weinsteinii]